MKGNTAMEPSNTDDELCREILLDREVSRMVKHFRGLRSMDASMYRESMWQYADMANGRDGGPGDSSGDTTTTIRHDYYKGYPDSFFMRVLSALGEFERYTTVAMDGGPW